MLQDSRLRGNDEIAVPGYPAPNPRGQIFSSAPLEASSRRYPFIWCEDLQQAFRYVGD